MRAPTGFQYLLKSICMTTFVATDNSFSLILGKLEDESVEYVNVENDVEYDYIFCNPTDSAGHVQQIFQSDVKTKYLSGAFKGSTAVRILILVEYELVPISELEAVLQFLSYVTQGE